VLINFLNLGKNLDFKNNNFHHYEDRSKKILYLFVDKMTALEERQLKYINTGIDFVLTSIKVKRMEKENRVFRFDFKVLKIVDL